MTTVSPSLLGRGTDLAALTDALERVRAGSAATILVGGEAGIGKTRLVQEFAGQVASRTRILIGGCSERGADGLPFAPFTAALRDLLSVLGQESFGELLPGDTAGELPRVLPALGRTDTGTDTSTARARLFEEVLALFGNIARNETTVLVIEDAHWAAASSCDLLDFLVRNQQSTPGLLIIVTYRSDELDRSHPLRASLAELERVAWVNRRELARLTRDEVNQQARHLLGATPSAERIANVYRRSDGIPLFVEALLAESGPGDTAPPRSLQDLLLAPIHRLPAETSDAVQVAAVGGVRVEHRLLAAVTGLDDAALSAALRPAVSTNVLRVEGEAYAFRHALIRDAVYDDQLPGDRIRRHLRYAEALESAPSLGPDGRSVLDLAHHWHQAGEPTRALAAAWHAAAHTAQSLAHTEQLGMLERVLQLWDHVDDPSTRIGLDHPAVLERAAEAARLAGEAERGVHLATEALAELGDDPVRSARLLTLRGGLLRVLGSGGDLDDLRTAARIVPHDEPGRARVLSALASRLMDIPAHDEARRVGEDALTLARRHADRESEVFSLVLLATLQSRFGDLEAQLPCLHEAQAIAHSRGAHYLLMRALHAETHLLDAYGEYERAAAVARRGLNAAAEAGVTRIFAGPQAISLVSSLVSLGRWDEAWQVADEYLALAPPPLIRADLWRQQAMIALARGDTSPAQLAVETGRGVAEGGASLVFPTACLEIELLLHQGDGEQACARARQIVAENDMHEPSRFSWPFLVAAARAAGAAGDADLLTTLRSHADTMQVVGPVQDAHRHVFHAETARAEGKDDREAWQSAVRAWENTGDPFELARALLGFAETAVAVDNDRDAAAEALRRADALVADLRAAPLRDAIARLARRARITLPGADVEDTDPVERVRVQLGLTNRELDVLRLVASGRDNHDIAAELFISAKTASVHVSRVLAKLGLTNRTEAAATAYRLGLVDS
ncbi:ATP-binding protein [Phytoactinopolyspora halophila]|nr:helix-turn-helix transcriptional regulator [Phytoactinopolyspora halophila]